MQNTENRKFILKSKRTAWRYSQRCQHIPDKRQLMGMDSQLNVTPYHYYSIAGNVQEENFRSLRATHESFLHEILGVPHPPTHPPTYL